MIAYEYPLIGVFWTTLMLFLWIGWFMLLIRVIADLFNSRDLGGVTIALWMVFVIFLPFLGVFVYLIARGGSMVQRDEARVREREQQFRARVRRATPTGGAADELTKLIVLKDRGILTDIEFNAQKAKLLA